MEVFVLVPASGNQAAGGFVEDELTVAWPSPCE